ncbi:MAG: GGDEF domain-containing protein, partial [Campylobacterales bacterium]|nr:GGDEF domain-containing protein [Campylobacterales bacterium]
MSHITIKQFWFYLFVANLLIVLGVLSFIRVHHFEKDTEKIKEILIPKFNIISYEVSQIIDEKDFKKLQNIIDFKSTANTLFKSICIVRKNTIVLSSDRECIDKNTDDLTIITYKDFKEIKDITPPIKIILQLNTYNYDEKYYLLFNLNYNEIEKFYTNSITQYIYPIILLSTVGFLLLTFLFYLLFAKPIERINDKIKSGKIKEEHFILDELNNLDKTLISQIKKIKSLSYIDELTQTYNRKSYNKRVKENLSLFMRYQTPFCLLMYDIDNFKKVNDTYGHNVGDKVLVEMSNAVQSLIRKNDYLFRVGGEEFVIILSETTLNEGKTVAEKIRKEVSKLQMIEGESVTISIGLTEVKKDDSDDNIYRRVDALLYYSKLNGKNRVSTKIVGDMKYGYYFDEERNTLYEKISGNFMNLEPFRKTLMD